MSRIAASWIFLILTPLIRAQGSPESEVRDFLNRLVKLQLKPDAAELDRMYAPDFTAVNAAGQPLNRSAVLTGLTSGRLGFRVYEIEDVTVQVHGDLAIVRDTEKIESNASAGRFRHLRILVKRDGRWQLLATQLTKIAEQ